ncbi:MAG TPA: hypothetical protein VNA69_19370 [Thermoanaerobaculia bacterium]|nr:hypothetical protein [Thermoanaerobaculia bacterium]
MSGKLPIDRVREARDAPSVYDDHRERFTRKRAKLDQTNELAEGERRPGPPTATEPSEPTEAPRTTPESDEDR